MSMAFERTGYWLTFLFEILLTLQCLSHLIIKVAQREALLILLQMAFKLIGIQIFYVAVTAFEIHRNHSMRVVAKDSSSEKFNKLPAKRATAVSLFDKTSGLYILKVH